MRRLVVVVSLLSLLTACRSGEKSSETAAETWSSHMQGLATDVRALLPYLYSRPAFSDPANRKEIKSAFSAFEKQTHAISPKMGQTFFGEDPLLQYSLQNLNEDVRRASEAFDLGQLEYSRGVAKAVVGHCFRCHSMTKVGAQAQWDVSNIPGLNLTPLERTDLMVATRKYEEAIQYLEGLLMNREFIQNTPFDFETALRKYLSLMIRVEDNPSRALSELDRILIDKSVPTYVADQARAWRHSLLDWNRSKKAKGRQNLLKLAEQRIRKAGDVQEYARDHAGDIEYLRVTSLLHDYLKSRPAAEGRAKAYFLLGQAYEVLDELGSWNLHELYYESCVRTATKSPLAKNCYKRLEASIYMGFSGSSGVHIPAQERTRLEKLKELAL